VPVQPDELDPERFLRLLADPLRWQLLQELAGSDRRVGDLCALLDQPQNLVSYHLRRLRTAGVISARRSAADGRDAWYRLESRRCRDLLIEAGRALHPGIRLAPITAAARATRPARSRPRTRVLFVCTGNSSRSQIAEALLEQRTGGAVAGRSAGSHPKPIHPAAVRAMAARGIDLSGRRSKHLRTMTRTRFDHVVTLCDKVREVCPEFPGHPSTSHWSMADPSSEPDVDAAVARTVDEIDDRLEFLIPLLHTSAPTATR
jgi:protein-tyrosine-phosphatase/DNA-binding transcriptional ArsR family regulator